MTRPRRSGHGNGFVEFDATESMELSSNVAMWKLFKMKLVSAAVGGERSARLQPRGQRNVQLLQDITFHPG